MVDRTRVIRLIVAVAAGLLMYSSFPPLGWWWAAVPAIATLAWVITRPGTTASGGFGYGFAFGMAFNLPSGQAVSRYMGIEPIGDADLWQGVNDGSGPAPLWFYILREAELRAQGRHLHGVGARIVAEVFIGLLEGDLASYLNHDPNWTPTLPKAGATYSMLDFLQFGEG